MTLLKWSVCVLMAVTIPIWIIPAYVFHVYRKIVVDLHRIFFE